MLWGGPFAACPQAEALAPASSARVGPVQFNPQASELSLRISGNKPSWMVKRNGARIRYMDLSYPTQEAIELQDDRSLVLKQVHPLVKEIRLAQRSKGVIRLVVEGTSDFDMAPTLTSDGTDWLLKVKLSPPQPAEAPTRESRSSIVRIALTHPLPSASTSIIPPLQKMEPATPSVKEPEAVVVTPPAISEPPFSPIATLSALPHPVLQPEPRTLERHADVELAYFRADLGEDYDAGNSKTKVTGNDVYAVTWHERFGSDWSSTLQLRRWGAYTIVDSDLAGSSHTRTETWLQAALAHTVLFQGIPQNLSLGYMFRSVQNENTFAAPQASYLFSKKQAYHGLVLGDHTTVPLVGPFSCILGISAQPFTIALLDAGVPYVGPLFGWGAQIGLEASVGGGIARLSYRHDTLRLLNGSFQDISGPELSLCYRF